MRFALAASIISTTGAASAVTQQDQHHAIIEVLQQHSSGGSKRSLLAGGALAGRAGRRGMRNNNDDNRRQRRGLLQRQMSEENVGSDSRRQPVTLCNLPSSSSSSSSFYHDNSNNSNNNEDFLGILSCGEGQYCVPVFDMMKSSSSYGSDDAGQKGICVDKPPVHHDDGEEGQHDETPGQRTLEEDVEGVITSAGAGLIDRFCTTPAAAEERQQQDNGGELAAAGAGDAGAGAEDASNPCDCSNVDFNAMTGTITCTFPAVCEPITDVCGDPLEQCYTTSYYINIMSTTEYTYKFCYDYSSPVVMSACYVQQFVYRPPGTVASPTSAGDAASATTMNDVGFNELVSSACDLGVYGTMCNSCRVVPKSADEPTTACFVMDCNNIPMEGPTALPRGVCEDDAPGSPLGAISEKKLIYDLLPCPGGCNLCGEEGSYMNSTDSTLTFPGTDFVYDCASLQIAAMSGGFADLGPEYGNVCNRVSVAAHSVCECLDKDGKEIVPPTLMPTVSAAPTMPPTALPDAADAALAPSAGAVGGRSTSVVGSAAVAVITATAAVVAAAVIGI